MVLPLATDKPHLVAILVGEHAVPVHLLLVDPALAVEGPGDERGIGEGDGREGHTSSLAGRGRLALLLMPAPIALLLRAQPPMALDTLAILLMAEQLAGPLIQGPEVLVSGAAHLHGRSSVVHQPSTVGALG